MRVKKQSSKRAHSVVLWPQGHWLQPNHHPTAQGMFLHRVKMMHCNGGLISASHLLYTLEMVWKAMMTVTGLDSTRAQVDEVKLWNPVFSNRQDGLQTRLLLVGLNRIPYQEQIAQTLHTWMR